MANYGYVTTKKKLHAHVVDAFLRKFIAERFKGHLVLEETRDNWSAEETPNSWSAYYYGKGTERDHGFRVEVELLTSRRLALRHGPQSDWSWYAQFVVQEALAEEFDGTCSDDGTTDRWRPGDLPKYTSYLAWMRSRYATVTPSLRYLLTNLAPLSVPPELRAL